MENLKVGAFMFEDCQHLRDILDAQLDIIERHIDRHKWFQQIENREEAISDFIEKYGFIMREFFCSRICEDRFDCRFAQEFNPR